jgi:nitric oxide reductase NorD protein
VTRRLDATKPIHSTRIGPAVRHAAKKLAKNEASTKVLLLVCDGRPYDLDYAPEGDEFPDIGYAVADTRRALEEARDMGLRVKVLGIDHNEQHYVREMCGPRIGHELLPSVAMLPQRLVSLYKDLSR